MQSPVVEKKVGDLIEGYRILREFGRGAASVIYLVQDPRNRQIWALKHVEKHDAKDQRFLDQAESEYKIASSLDHPSIRKIERLIKVKAGLITTRELCLVMEFVDGISEDRQPPRTFEKAVDIFSQVAHALGHMHSRGYVHADMKPNNIMVTDGLARIIDLGQSCKIGTVKERIQGTPDYIAPEQVRRKQITAETDIYNMGATMYFLLTRQHIPTIMPTMEPTVALKNTKDCKPPRELNPQVPPALSSLVMHCIELEPADRPQSMHQVQQRLAMSLSQITRAEAEPAVNLGG